MPLPTFSLSELLSQLLGKDGGGGGGAGIMISFTDAFLLCSFSSALSRASSLRFSCLASRSRLCTTSRSRSISCSLSISRSRSFSLSHSRTRSFADVELRMLSFGFTFVRISPRILTAFAPCE